MASGPVYYTRIPLYRNSPPLLGAGAPKPPLQPTTWRGTPPRIRSGRRAAPAAPHSATAGLPSCSIRSQRDFVCIFWPLLGFLVPECIVGAQYVSRFTGLSPYVQWLRFQHVSAYSFCTTSGKVRARTVNVHGCIHTLTPVVPDSRGKSDPDVAGDIQSHNWFE